MRQQNEIEFDEIENDPKVKAEVKKQVDGMYDYTKKLQARVDTMRIIHEDLIIVEKLDVMAIKSFLSFSDTSRFDQARRSFYGRLLGISPVESNEINEVKKKLLKIGDIIEFNPDSAYSMNIIVPDEHPELWCLAIDSVLFADDGFDPSAAKARSIETNIIIGRINENQRLEKARMATMPQNNQPRRRN